MKKILKRINKVVREDNAQGYDYETCGVIAEAEILIGKSFKDGMTSQTITSGGIWNIDADEPEEIDNMYEGQLEILIFYLKCLGFTDKEIKEAKKDD